MRVCMRVCMCVCMCVLCGDCCELHGIERIKLINKRINMSCNVH